MGKFNSGHFKEKNVIWNEASKKVQHKKERVKFVRE